ncbi:hypothetical protein [Priestia megaterium]|uniref:hypothetical protein n=1 Tax=Priestia megaterium TaxID=1404 RepID=UPI000BFCB199|nr:hypothetical protein [Priestia megaterium]PGQ88177.1 hypothetical protein COA18_04435 [Priestia megaterium]
MKTINPLFISVFVNDRDITCALNFDYKEAESTMIGMLQNNFNVRTDDALIYVSQHPGEAKPIFSYRSYLNDEAKPDLPVGKENKHVKVFFDCPRCPSTSGKLKADEDNDIVMVCNECKHPVLVN